jgi:hypothetical protein
MCMIWPRQETNLMSCLQTVLADEGPRMQTVGMNAASAVADADDVEDPGSPGREFHNFEPPVFASDGSWIKLKLAFFSSPPPHHVVAPMLMVRVF